jgi:hypothetical protein
MNFKRSGKFCNAEALAIINSEWDKALKTPVMTFRSDLPDMAASARKIVTDNIHDLALKYGCEDNGEPWGIDMNTGEFFQEEK